MRRRILAATLVIIGIVFAGGLAAWAFFSASSTASQLVTSSTLTAPGGASAAAASSTSITVTVSSGPSSPSPAASGYNVYAHGTTLPASALCTISGTTGSCTVNGLTAGTNYSFDIYSTLSNWISATSTTVSATTYAPPTISVNTVGSIATSGAAATRAGASTPKAARSPRSILLLHERTDQLHQGDRLYRRRLEPHGRAARAAPNRDRHLVGLTAGHQVLVHLEAAPRAAPPTTARGPASPPTPSPAMVTNAATNASSTDHRDGQRHGQHRLRHRHHAVLLCTSAQVTTSSCTGTLVGGQHLPLSELDGDRR